MLAAYMYIHIYVNCIELYTRCIFSLRLINSLFHLTKVRLGLRVTISKSGETSFKLMCTFAHGCLHRQLIVWNVNCVMNYSMNPSYVLFIINNTSETTIVSEQYQQTVLTQSGSSLHCYCLNFSSAIHKYESKLNLNILKLYKKLFS